MHSCKCEKITTDCAEDDRVLLSTLSSPARPNSQRMQLQQRQFDYSSVEQLALHIFCRSPFYFKKLLAKFFTLLKLRYVLQYFGGGCGSFKTVAMISFNCFVRF